MRKKNTIISILIYSLTALILVSLLIWGLYYGGSGINLLSSEGDSMINKSAVVRIVVYSITALVLTAMLVWGLIFNGFGIFGLEFFNGFSFGANRSPSYRNSDLYSVGGADINTAGISEIEINWSAGSLKAEPYDRDVISFSETSDNQLSDERLLRYLVDGNRLIIQFAESNVNFGFKTLKKDLVIYIPRELAQNMDGFYTDCVSAGQSVVGISAKTAAIRNISGKIKLESINSDDLKASSVSGSINASWVNAKSAVLKTTSGSMEMNGAEVDSLDVNSVSGSVKIFGNVKNINAKSISGGVQIEGSFNEIKASSVSGAIRANSSSQVFGANLSSTSGSVTLKIPEGYGFSANYSSVSGGFTCDFPVVTKSGKAVYLDGGADYKLSTVSGSIKIQKYE